MFGFRFLKGSAVFLATLGMMAPQYALLADSSQTTATKAIRIDRIPDLLLGIDGTMTGRVCDRTGKIIEGTKVDLKQNNKTIGVAVTNRDGIYKFKDVKAGVYRVSSGNTEGTFRVWTRSTAPPSAKEHALLVLGENGSRGQFGAVDPSILIVTSGVIAAVAVSTVALVKINDLSDLVSQIPVSP